MKSSVAPALIVKLLPIVSVLVPLGETAGERCPVELTVTAPEIEPLPPRAPVSVPFPTVTGVAERLPVTSKVPPLIFVAPEYWLAPLIVIVPEPTLVRVISAVDPVGVVVPSTLSAPAVPAAPTDQVTPVFPRLPEYVVD